MDRPARQIARPRRPHLGHVALDQLGEARPQILRLRQTRRDQPLPAVDAQRIRPFLLEPLQRHMHAGQHFANGGAMTDVRRTRPYALKKRDNRRRPPLGVRVERAGFGGDRLRRGYAAFGQARHDLHEERQILFAHTLFEEGENELPRRRTQQIVRILHTLGDAFARGRRPQIVFAEQLRQIGVGEGSVDGH